MRSLIILIVVLGSVLSANAQWSNARSRSELGVLVGGSYYLGDLNPFRQYRNTQLAGGLLYRYNIHSRTSVRVSFSYMSVEASDADAKLDLYRDRNLNFKSDIWELASGVEFNYFPFQIGDSRYKGTAYLFAGLAAFRMNPKTDYNGSEVELQPLGTEGQGSSLNSKGHYSLFQIAIPLGVGARVSLGKAASLGMEFGIRKTFTDYLDDVGSDAYIDPDALEAANGPLASALSNRSGSRFGKRGNASTKDWYVFSGLTLTFRLGSPDKCFHH